LVSRGFKSIVSYLENTTNMDVFKFIPEGQIISKTPTREVLINKLQGVCERSLSYYKKFPQTQVTDNWQKSTLVKNGSPMNRSIPQQQRAMDSGKKRFSGKIISAENQVIDTIKTSKGMIAEGYIIAHLNTGLKCPICKEIGKIGWCDGFSDINIDSFRDGVCMNCREKGIATLFEIKTRWENSIKDNNVTYAGNFSAINTLMSLRSNIFLVVASIDTGDIRIGKITSARIRGNKRWLYSIQEDLGWGSPSSYVVCDGGLHKIPVKMSIIIDIMTDKYCESIFDYVLKNNNLI